MVLSTEWLMSAVHLQVRPPMAFVHFFLIEVSYNAVTSGALQTACSAIARVLDELQGATPLNALLPLIVPLCGTCDQPCWLAEACQLLLGLLPAWQA